ncbi:MAG TPA: response regulator [Salinivirgaceae bacterium]|nr:response regulator [Salinivirgaceae bacterium]
MLIRLLIIDDDIIMREILKDALMEYPIIIDEASNGWEGMEKIKQNNYHVVLTDIIMPEKEGLELIREIKAKPNSVKVIATSSGGGGSAKMYLQMAAEFGADAIIEKPFTENSLVELIQQILSTHEQI